jgi:hypothetical protein
LAGNAASRPTQLARASSSLLAVNIFRHKTHSQSATAPHLCGFPLTMTVRRALNY